MKNYSGMPRALTVLACVVLILLSACMTKPPEDLLAEEVTWVPFHSETMGITLKVPKEWTASLLDHHEGVIFRQQGYPVLMIVLMGEGQSSQQGLWADFQGQSTGLETLSGQSAQRYAYDHPDIIFVMPTISWVIPWRGQYLELAFRTSNSEPSPIQRAILDGLVLSGPVS